MTLALGNGQPDSFFVDEVRRIFRDQGHFVQEAPGADGQRGGYGSAASSPIKLQQAPVLRTLVFITAPAALNQPLPGTATQPTYLPIFDPLSPTSAILPTPVLTAGGAGIYPQGTYQVVLTYQVGAAEVGMSAPSNALQLGPSLSITLGALAGLPSAVTAINVYLITSSGGPIFVGKLGQITVVANATPQTTYNVAGNGVLPVLIVTDTGELWFPLPPTTGSIQRTPMGSHASCPTETALKST